MGDLPNGCLPFSFLGLQVLFQQFHNQRVVEVAMNKPINMMMDEQWIDELKMVARQRSLDRRVDVSYTDLIREAVKEMFFSEQKPADESM